MKPKIIIFIFCANTLFQLNAQNTKINKSIFVQSGIVNGLGGYNVTAGFEELFGNHKLNGFAAGINFQDVDNSYSSADMIINEKSYFINIGYKRYFEMRSLNHFSPYAGLGILGGITHISENNNGVFHVNKHNEFLYGVISSIGIEYKLNKISPYLEGSYYFTGDHFLRVNLGFKYHF